MEGARGSGREEVVRRERGGAFSRIARGIREARPRRSARCGPLPQSVVSP